MEAAGLASSILTFIDVSYKIAKGTYEIYQSATGVTAENAHVSNIITDLEDAAAGLGTVFKGHHAELENLSNQCRTLSVDLLKLLGRLERREKKLSHSFKAAIVCARKQKDIASIEKRLDQYRQQIMLHLTLNTYRDESPIKARLDRIRDDSSHFANEHAAKLDALQNQLSKVLGGVERANSRLFLDKQVSRVQESNKAYLSPINGLHRDESAEEASHRTTHDDGHAPRATDLGYLARLLNDLKTCANTIEVENKILQNLYFDTIFQRERSISEATSNTFGWTVKSLLSPAISRSADTDQLRSTKESRRFSSSSSSSETSDRTVVEHAFNTWKEKLLLETQRREAMARSLHSFLKDEGEVFFICGKAGSGKSTLMKFLSQHSSVRETLASCANGRKLVLINTFFWSSGDPLQKSLEGLYRTILFHTLRQCPELLETFISTLAGTASSSLSAAMSLSELKAAFSRMQLLEDAASYFFCYFIDGLDEYEGDSLDHKHLAEMLRAWARADNVKVVCSARPSAVTLDIFGASNTFFELHDLTKADIYAFAKTQFEEHLREPAFETGQAACLGMLQTIAERADGVFLWASLVVRALLNAVLEHEDEFSIRRRLEECPQSLSQLFRQMLDAIDPSPSVRLRSEFLLQLVASREAPIVHFNALTLSWLDESRTFQALLGLPKRSNHERYTASRIATEQKRARSQLHTLTRGLLNMETNQSVAYLVSNKYGYPSYYRFQLGFFHRTVKDFLTEEWLPSLTQRPLMTSQQEAAVKAELLIAEIKHCPEPHLGLWKAVYPACYFNMLDFFTSFRLSPIRELGLFTALVQEMADAVCGTNDARAARSEQQDSIRWLSHNMLVPEREQPHYKDPPELALFSFLHLAATLGLTEYVKESIASVESPTAVDTSDINLLLSGAYSANLALIDFLLQKDWHPSDLISSRGLKSSSMPEGGLVSVWEAFLHSVACLLTTFCASEFRGPVWKAVPLVDCDELLNDNFAIVESFLRSGADPRVEILVRDQDNATDLAHPEQETQARRLARPAYRVSLSHIVQLVQPKNIVALQTLSTNRAKSKRNVIRKMLSHRTMRQPRHQVELAGYPMVTMDYLFTAKWEVTGLVSLGADHVYINFGNAGFVTRRD
ncbi:hypothetical protein BDP55DRAFT_717828 [Colletotrichum godetiae]|uniref:NACHT domain-containing protein n=1 Tax=Colletotrichum godetiae TaxID=1209918 RepID=A0AAJ0AFE5_9PEZI|nr:uncharacterized protein BDP55DRAFT_717828 [Colletotrichum godetiae]KAK1672889.1 hypothetical protein BDP55DRAFT_717828 [Colletotrichum godetiae]